MRHPLLLARPLALPPSGPVAAHDRIPATVVDQVDGDTLKVRLEHGRVVTVR